MSQPQNVAGKELVGPLDLSDEHWREYDWNGRVYRIDSPTGLFYRIGGTTHRVVDVNGITHCVPAPTADQSVVLRWKSKTTQGVSF